jgi:hypothetical protein
MINFDTKDKIILGTNDDLGYTFGLPVSSSTTSEDGALPYGTVIAAITSSKAYKRSGTTWGTTDLSSDLIVLSDFDDESISFRLKYPATNGTGFYKIVVDVLLDSGESAHVEFINIEAK